jgi:6-phosphogluconolactonase (cycloisomerase 2 family)
LATSTVFGAKQEAILFVPDPACDGEANLLAVKNNCACDTNNGRSDEACCTAPGTLVSARIMEGGGITVVSEVDYAGMGPIHMALQPTGYSSTLKPLDGIAVADYIGGTAHIYGPIDPTTGVLGDLYPDVVSTTKLSNRSLAHMVTSDPLCGQERRMLVVDSDYPAVVVVDPRTGGVVDVIDMPDRIRRIDLHPSLPVAYAMYEAAGSIGVWSWPRCEKWVEVSDFTGRAMAEAPVELARFSTMPAEPPPPAGTLNKPTSLLLSPDGAYAYTCTRTAFFTPTTASTSRIGVFRLSAGGKLATPIQWFDTGGYNTRDCELAADGSMLFAVDVVTSRFLAYRIDPRTGTLALAGSADVPYPTMIEQYRQHATCIMEGGYMQKRMWVLSLATAAVGVGGALVVGATVLVRGGRAALL